MALNIAPFDPKSTDYAPDDVFQCELDDSEHEFHCAYLRDIPGDEREVFYAWTPEGNTRYVLVLRACRKKYKDEGESCGIFRNHSGVCDWEYVDPSRIALNAEMDQAMAYLRDHGTLPPSMGVE